MLVGQRRWPSLPFVFCIDSQICFCWCESGFEGGCNEDPSDVGVVVPCRKFVVPERARNSWGNRQGILPTSISSSAAAPSVSQSFPSRSATHAPLGDLLEKWICIE